VTIGDVARAAGAALLDMLHGADVPATWSLEARPMKAQFKMADRAGAAFVAILGDQELADGTVTLRRLVDGVQKAVPTGDVVRWLTRLDDWSDRA
jgi:histidyl-tRNA synthetase